LIAGKRGSRESRERCHSLPTPARAKVGSVTELVFVALPMIESRVYRPSFTDSAAVGLLGAA
jgi:hypothetical protein